MGEAIGQHFGIFFFDDLPQALVKQEAQRTDGDAEEQVGGARHEEKCTRAKTKTAPPERTPEGPSGSVTSYRTIVAPAVALEPAALAVMVTA